MDEKIPSIRSSALKVKRKTFVRDENFIAALKSACASINRLSVDFTIAGLQVGVFNPVCSECFNFFTELMF